MTSNELYKELKDIAKEKKMITSCFFDELVKFLKDNKNKLLVINGKIIYDKKDGE